MTLDELKRFAPNGRADILNGLIKAWPEAVAAGINTPLRTQHFMAQAFVESQGFSRVEEILRYSAERLVAVWPKRFPTLAAARPYAHNPQVLANKVYGGRMGNTGPDDGWKYRGRGIKQITGRDNYAACGKALGVDLVGDPDKLLDPVVGARAAIWFWSANGCNGGADRDNVRAVTLRINGGLNGIEDREAALERAKSIFTAPMKGGGGSSGGAGATGSF